MSRPRLSLRPLALLIVLSWMLIFGSLLAFGGCGGGTADDDGATAPEPERRTVQPVPCRTRPEACQ